MLKKINECLKVKSEMNNAVAALVVEYFNGEMLVAGYEKDEIISGCNTFYNMIDLNAVKSALFIDFNNYDNNRYFIKRNITQSKKYTSIFIAYKNTIQVCSNNLVSGRVNTIAIEKNDSSIIEINNSKITKLYMKYFNDFKD